MNQPAEQPHQNTEFIRQAVEWLHTTTFDQALDFYEDLAKDPNCDDWTLAELGKNDRFFLLTHLCNRVDAIHPWQYDRAREVEAQPDECIDLWARDHYKDLASNTPIYTPDGWTTHGDLRIGDHVYSPTGKPVRVLGVTETYQNSETYEIVFACGEKIIAGAGHIWDFTVNSKKRTPYGREGRMTITGNTLDLINWYKKSSPVGVNITQPLQNDSIDLEIDPYVLGCWLGDGHAAGSRFTTSDPEVFKHFPYLVEKQSGKYGYVIRGIDKQLKSLNLINNKHIPKNYMRGSISQRRELLQGLMDTDGHYHKTDGMAVFVQIPGQLADDTEFLLRSLGYKPKRYEYINNHKGHVRIQWTADKHTFKLTRKKKDIKPREWVKYDNKIVSIKRVSSVPTQCIQVEGGRYLAGKHLIPTHNSTWITFAGSIQEIINDPEITIGIFSHTRPIAKGFVTQIKSELENNVVLKRLYPNILYDNPKREAPRWSAEALTVQRKSNPKEATVEAWGMVDGQPTSTHFALLIFDDVVTLESVNTPDQIIKTTKAWEIAQNLGRSTDPRRWHIGTRYNFADTWGVLLGRKFLTPRIYAATDDGTIDGKPVYLTPKVWEKKKRESSVYTIACQQLLNPVAGSEQTFKPEWIRYWEIRPKTLNVYIMVDYAGSRASTGSSNTAIAVIGINVPRNKYLLDGVCHKMGLSERWKHVKALRKYWLAQPGIQTVTVGYERYGAQSDIEHFKEMMQIEGEHFEIVELNWPRDGQHSKDERIKRLQPDHQNWRFFYPRPPTGPLFDEKGQLITEKLQPSQTKLQLRAIQAGDGYLVAKPIKAKDENGKIYDVVEKFVTNEYLFFPNTTYKDFFDAMSRIYDMDLQPPILYSDEDTLPEVAED